MKWELSGIALRVTALLPDGTKLRNDTIFVLEAPNP